MASSSFYGITQFGLRNFKNLAEVPEAGTTPSGLLDFSPLNVLIGPNGCGKSSMLQSIDFLRAFFMSSVDMYLQQRQWDYKDLLNLRNSSKKIQWELKARLPSDSSGAGAGDYHYRVELQPRKHLGIGQESLVFTAAEDTVPIRLVQRQGRKVTLYNSKSRSFADYEALALPASVLSTIDDAKKTERDKFPEMIHFRSWVENFRTFLIWDPKILRSPSRGNHDIVGESGENLASVLGALKERNPASFAKLANRVERLFPTITDIEIEGTKFGWRRILLKEKNVAFNSMQASDGVLRLLAIASLLYAENPPSVVLMEEPENGVHPQLVKEVIDILVELTLRKPPRTTQVFFTTHSPYVLDHFLDHPERVYTFDRTRPQAGAQVRRLSSGTQVDSVRKSFQSLGEAWFNGTIGATAK